MFKGYIVYCALLKQYHVQCDMKLAGNEKRPYPGGRESGFVSRQAIGKIEWDFRALFLINFFDNVI